MPKGALPIPKGMSWNQIKKMRVNEGEWHEFSGFVCRKCKKSAFLHPHTNNIWGCKKCGFTTTSVSLYFQLKAEVAV